MMYINEIIKMLKKKSTIIILLLSILSLFACVGFVKITDMDTFSSSNYLRYRAQEYNNKISEIKSNDEISLNTKKQYENIINLLNYASDDKIDLNDQTYYMSNSINSIINDTEAIIALTDKNEIKNIQNRINKYNEVIKEKSFDKYVICLQDNLKTIENEDTKKNREYELGIIKKYEIGKTNLKEDSWKASLLSEIVSTNESLSNKIDYKTQKPFTFKQINEYKDNLKIAEYKLENNIKEDIGLNGTPTNKRYMYNEVAITFSMSVICILIILLSASTISSETSKGTIKFLVMQPKKRYKILLSKIFAITTLLIGFTLIISICNIVVSNIFYRAYDAIPYVYMNNGSVSLIDGNLFIFLRYAVIGIEVFVYSMIGIMLSTLIRNTAVSTSITIALYFVSGTIMQFVNMFVTKDFVKYIPFNNIDLTSKIFDKHNSMINMMSSEFMNNVTLNFSLTVIGVTLILITITAFESFNKREIM
ncbi:MAG: ABC transporter permease subunit [Clostridia bacterium]